MFKIGQHIKEEIRDSNIILEQLNNEEKSGILDVIYKKYVDKNKKGRWIWEKLIHSEFISDSMGWSYINEFIKDNNCIMFFNQDDEKDMFFIQNGEDLKYILSETSCYEFYITDINCSYMICFNHHDILIGCGLAEKWIKELCYN